ncbi:MAG: hypothetical protein NVSMB63_14440 [Sediminibacterium sp.]
MKRTVATLFFAFIAAMAIGQIKDPVSWTYAATKKSAGTYEVVLTASVAKPWHIYSQHTGEGGPIPTRIRFKANPLVKVTGEAREAGKLEKTFDENFKTNVLYFSGKVQFVQTVKVKNNIKTNISGTLEYMVCDDTQCLPPTKKSFDLKLQ